MPSEKSKYTIHGTVAPGYEPVREQFESNFRRGVEEHAQVCAYVKGQRVVDLWEDAVIIYILGSAPSNSSFTGNSLVTIFSSTKSLTAMVFATLVDAGLLDYSDKVSQHWPEFGAHGKEDITVSQVLRHEAGLAKIRGFFNKRGLYAEHMTENILGEYMEQQKLRFPPEDSGTTRQYHSLSRGFILQELFRRVDSKKRTIGQYLRKEISEPLEADVFLGARDAEIKRRFGFSAWSKEKVFKQLLIPPFEVFERQIDPNALGYLGNLYYAHKVSSIKGRVPWDEDTGHRTNASFVDLLATWGADEVLKGEIPSANAVASARGLAKIGSVMANGGQQDDGFKIMSKSTWDKMHSERTVKKDFSSPFAGYSPLEFSLGGLAVFSRVDSDSKEGLKIRLLREGYFGWYGFGGSVFMWNPDLRIGFGYVPTLLAWYDPYNMRGAKLQKAVADCARKIEEEDKKNNNTAQRKALQQ